MFFKSCFTVFLNVYFIYSSLPVADKIRQIYLSDNITVKKELVNHYNVKWEYSDFELKAVPCLKKLSFQGEKYPSYTGRLLILFSSSIFFDYGYIKQERFFNFHKTGNECVFLFLK